MASISPLVEEDKESLPSLGSSFHCNSWDQDLALSGTAKLLGVDLVVDIALDSELFGRVEHFVVVLVAGVFVDRVGSVFYHYGQHSYRWCCINWVVVDGSNCCYSLHWRVLEREDADIQDGKVGAVVVDRNFVDDIAAGIHYIVQELVIA